ncbi:hypothetical protein V5O48_009877 [Marasmius crinis-equi]|uniref:F-box domain-containing protein n=1 Tax=Marasmius crinis-equi TaxID=585013 RepID=A0ABR3F9X2_9AGAR
MERLLYSCTRCSLRVGEFQEAPPSEEFLSLSKSNDAPSPSSVHGKIHAQYMKTLEALQTLESHIEQLSVSLDSLRAEKKKMERKRRLYTSILHPIRQIPPEILSEIFRFCTAIDTEETDFPACPLTPSSGSFDTRNSPWVLGQVCRSWRAVALSTTDLWTRIDLAWIRSPINGSGERAENALEALLTSQLQRSGKRPLTIFYTSGLHGDKNVQERLLSRLCAWSSQWENVFLQGDAGVFKSLSQYRGLFPSLRTLHASFLQDDWSSIADVDGTGPFCAFDAMPGLERLAITGEAGAVLQRGDQFQWKQITHYVAEESAHWWPDLNEHYQILPKLENVRTVFLNTATPDNWIPGLPSQPTLQLYFLHTLVVATPDEGNSAGLEPLLKWLVLPALRILRLPYGFDCPKALIGLLERSQCSLEELTIVEMCDSVLDMTDEFIRILHTSSLRDLHTLGLGATMFGPFEGQRKLSDDIFKVLTLSEESGQGRILPKLQCLILYGPDMIWTDGTLLNLVASRRSTESLGACPLRQLILWDIGKEGEESLTPEEAGKFAELTEGGLSFGIGRGTLDWHASEIPCLPVPD